ncbi:hypothetical protein KW419_16170 [Vibrio fluvialis]|uniref:hypothetical protein n=1 Tax=Vibrio fluvialis TaxID=676 RepID=UPI001C9D14C8|nr:hypothetical protein [Vibrio fluvialis]MBY7859782.1 hypothetical protein [Vibrio fluvialis]MBY7925025.1 hypothetical protein [Vibrio fluvialis]MBY7980830.1 hypothetical protein [Vibrio fluvialis]MBY8233181.1 hypothetical protein [Vibrio fluvialis]
MNKPTPTSKQERVSYVVLTPFPWHKGHWTEKGQVLSLLPQEAQALLINQRIKAAPKTSRKTETQAQSD